VRVRSVSTQDASTPALQAHSVLRYTRWRAVIAEYVAERVGLQPQALLPQTVGQVSLARALTAFDAWLNDPDASLEALLDQSMQSLQHLLADWLRPELPGHRGQRALHQRLSSASIHAQPMVPWAVRRPQVSRTDVWMSSSSLTPLTTSP